MPLTAPGSTTRASSLRSPSPQPLMTLTGEQEAVLSAAHDGGTVVVEALAGTGKTSTLVEIARSFPRRPGLYLAFNKSVQIEAEKRFPDWVDVRTAHSVAYQAVGKRFSHRLPGNPGASRMSAQAMSSSMRVKPAEYGGGTLNPVMVTRLAQATVNRFMKSVDSEIVRHHVPTVLRGVDVGDAWSAVHAVAVKIWADMNNPHGKFRFTPDVYLKMWQLSNPRLPVDYILFDEAQDADPVIASVVNAQPVQKIYVGDRNQAIYGWRGAVDAMARIQDATRLPLTKSFRFGPAIAAAANEWLGLLGSDLQVVGHDPIQSRIATGGTPRAILCRGNGTALGWVISLQGLEIPVALAPGDKNAGKDIERFAWAARDLMNGKGTDHPDLFMFESWQQLVKFVDEEEDTDDLKRMVGIINRVGVNSVIDAVRGLVPEAKAAVTVSTAHKAKGLEWSHVKVADDFCPPEPDEEGRMEVDPADLMLAYVTVTRAKEILDPGPLGDPHLWKV